MRRIHALGAVAALALGLAAFGTEAVWAQGAPAAGGGAAARPPVKDTRSADPSIVQSGNYMSEPNHSRILWSVSHNGFSTFTAVLPQYDAKLTLDAKDPTKSTLDVTVPMDKITTGVPEAAFTEQLKGDRWFNVAKFPTATFHATNIQKTGPNKAAVTGNLTFLGVTKPATLMVEFNQAGEGPAPGYKIGFNGMMVIKRSDWGLTTLVPGVSDQVSLQIEAEFIPAK
jgi:polyisoprenoid-binding protein YceI